MKPRVKPNARAGTAIASNFWGIFKQIFSTNYPNVVTALGFANAKTT
jgi:hypothetical protein